MKNMLLFYTSLNFLLIFICAKISYKLKFLDNPNKRKIHKVPIAYTGGVALSIGYLFALEMFDVTDKDFNLIYIHV